MLSKSDNNLLNFLLLISCERDKEDGECVMNSTGEGGEEKSEGDSSQQNVVVENFVVFMVNVWLLCKLVSS